ncbi:MAG: dihydrofolate synthase / folylpolyglutamate synthase [Gaiellaceae bacterium]|nr:dihydrofolate synthase / folylpolyglutamate synthase [Gaiellaceae bacterium]
MPSPAEHTAWLESLSPWPEELGLGRMRTLLASLGDPSLAYPAIHVVGTNGKSTATRTIEALLLAEGLSVGATVSPHVRSWAERITVGGEQADFEEAIERVRPEAESQGATQFETICAAAFAEFAVRNVEVAVVEAGLGGRLDATNVLRSHVVLLTNVGLEHTDVLGETREQIAGEKLAVVQEGTVVVLPDDEFAHFAGPHVVLGGAAEAATAFLGRPVQREVEVALPGRLERRAEDEVWDGAHNADGARWLVARLARRDYTVLASILRDKDTVAMLSTLATSGGRFVATQSSSARALSAAELGRLAADYFDEVLVEPDPVAALALARERRPVLVTGSLYLLADLARNEA